MLLSRKKVKVDVSRAEVLQKKIDELTGGLQEYRTKYSIAHLQNELFFNYQKWLVANYPNQQELDQQKLVNKKFGFRPLVSILVPVYNTPIDLLRECLDSVVNQSYDNWELCVVDDHSKNRELTAVLDEYATTYADRFTYMARKQNGHISKASNDALDMAKGDFVALLDHDDVMWPNALHELVKKLNEDKTIDVIYTDEDKLEDGVVHSHPYQKPAYNKYFLKGCNYITHFALARTALVKKIGGFREKVEGAQDWDLFLRLSEQTDNIKHVPMIVYSWRVIETSTAKGGFEAKPYAYNAQKKAVTDHFESKGVTIVDAALPQGFVGWMLQFGLREQIQLSVVIDQAYAPSDVATLVTRVNEALATDIKARYYVVGTRLRKRFEEQFPYMQDTDIVFVDELTVNTIQGDYVMYTKSIFDLNGERGWLNNLLGYTTLPDVDIVTCQIRAKDHTILSAGVVLGQNGEPVHLLHGYYKGVDQRLDTNLLSPRSIEVADERFFMLSNKLFVKYLSSPTRSITKLAVKQRSSVVYSPFVAMYAVSDMTSIYVRPSINNFAYDVPEDSPYWGTDTIYSIPEASS